MGYTTEFEGEFTLNKPLLPKHAAYLKALANTRRMMRASEKVKNMPDPIRDDAGLPVGIEGEFFVGGLGFMGQNDDLSILDFNNPPATQPGLWCQWIPSDNGKAIIWNEGEKFYYYREWLAYILTNFIIPWGYVLNGSVNWEGEDSDDVGVLTVKDNELI